MGQYNLANHREAHLQEEVEGQIPEEMLLEGDLQVACQLLCAINVVEFTPRNVGVLDLI